MEIIEEYYSPLTGPRLPSIKDSSLMIENDLTFLNSHRKELTYT